MIAHDQSNIVIAGDDDGDEEEVMFIDVIGTGT
jgi:hypothetical protein